MAKYLVETFTPYSWKIFENFEEAMGHFIDCANRKRCRSASIRELLTYDSILWCVWGFRTGFRYYWNGPISD